MEQLVPPTTEGVSLHHLADLLLSLSDQLRWTARELEGSQRAAPLQADTCEVISNVEPRVLAGIAQAIYRARQRRHRYFNAELFGEPAWDMLLELFVNKADGSSLSTSSICLAAGVPLTTGLRCLDRLVDQGLVRRLPSPGDRRVVTVELTDLGFELVRTYLSTGIVRDEMPLPGEIQAA